MSENVKAPEQKSKPLSQALKIFYGVGDCSFSLMAIRAQMDFSHLRTCGRVVRFCFIVVYLVHMTCFSQ